jgi:serine phosphatase RsbU (regulator of sigma subunit)
MIYTQTMAFVAECQRAGARPEGAELLRQINQLLWGTGRGRLSSTLASLVIDRVEQKLHVASAAHPWPILVPNVPPGEKTDSFAYRSLMAKGDVLGLGPELKLKVLTVPFRSGDRVLMYTDGLLERRNEAGAVFGPANVNRCVRTHVAAGLEELSSALIAKAKAHGQDRPLEDDMTLVIVEQRLDAATLGKEKPPQTAA